MKKVPVDCPKCGHRQEEPASAYSTVCKSCRQHYRIEDAKKPAAKATAQTQTLRSLECFNCSTPLTVSPSAQSTMCKKCSTHIDLQDYKITSAVSRNFKTKGRFVIEQGGFLFNTDSLASTVTIRGRLLGKIRAEGDLEIYSTADIKGSFHAGNLVIPVTERFRWPEVISVTGADIAGELVANVKATGRIIVRASARFFGDVESGHLVIEPGAVFVGRTKVGNKKA